jgi:hypothetical protein
MTKKKIEKIAEELGWTVTWYKNSRTRSVMFSQYSPAGQDFNVELDYKTLGEIEDKLREYYDNYDPSYEAYLWLDESGHGKNGAPYEMIDVYNDMVACEEMIDELACAIEE